MQSVAALNDGMRQIVSLLVDVFQPVSVILFGSVATGAATSDSDLDFAVIVRERTDYRQRMTEVNRKLSGMDVDVDVVVVPQDRFEMMKDIIGWIEHSINKYGLIAYHER